MLIKKSIAQHSVNWGRSRNFRMGGGRHFQQQVIWRHAVKGRQNDDHVTFIDQMTVIIEYIIIVNKHCRSQII